MFFDLEFMKEFTGNIGNLMGSNCEILIHDFEGDLDHTIIHIVNGHVSGREVGDPPSTLYFETIKDVEKSKLELKDYYSTTDDGRILRCTTTLLCDRSGRPRAAVCVNMDITDIIKTADLIKEIIGASYEGHHSIGTEKYITNVNTMLDNALAELEISFGKPGSEMNKEERSEAIARLDEYGMFAISKAHVKVCEFFGISKFTLYNHLDSIRGK
ncbi:MAG: transcriptional regulator [Firmicutes bacterium]|nr:transcriptional regulator [Bacillota bacterium]MBQ9972813.1 transcriptional regulator [Bacillota bacterium]